MFSASFRSFVWTLTALAVSLATGMAVAKHAGPLAGAMALPSFLAIPLEYQAESPIIFTLMGVVAGLLAFFLLGYVLQGLVDALRLARVKQAIDAAAKAGRFASASEHPTEWNWPAYPLFSQLWRDFAETLHLKHDPQGQVRYRATQPAELVFSHQVLVDTPMRVEFFRHLPGILTGAGIVSTFAGILLGLTEFNPTVAPDQVTLQLKNLFTGVSTAFVASFFAIFTAIVVTAFEKLLLSLRYAQVTHLQRMLDEHLKGGVESDYLAQMAEGGARQAERIEKAAERMVSTLALAKGGDAGALVEALERMGRTMAEGVSTANADMARQLLERMTDERQELVRSLGENARLLEGMSDRLASLDRRLEGMQQQGREDLQGLRQGLVEALGRVEQGMSGGQSALREELIAGRNAMEPAMQRLAGLLEGASGQSGESLGSIAAHVERLSQASGVWSEQNSTLQQSLARLGEILAAGRGVEAAVGSVREEMGRALEQVLAAHQASAHHLGSALRESTQGVLAAQQESARERDAFLVARLAASQGELAERIKETTDAVRAPVERLAAGMESVREEHARQGRQLTEAILEAFAASLRESVTTLAARLEELSQRIREEREAMEQSLGQLVRSLAEASREGGDRLADHMEKALAGAESRQDAMLETLTRFAAGMKVDLGLLQEKMQQTTQEVSRQIVDQTLSITAESGSDLIKRIQESAHTVTGELRQTLESLAAMEMERDQARDAALKEHVERTGGDWGSRLQEFFQKGSEVSTQTVTAAIQNAGEMQRRQVQEVNDMLLTVLASKLEENFRGISGNLAEMQQRFVQERQEIKSAMQGWIDELGRSSHAEARALAERIRDVMDHAENRHQGVIHALDSFGKSLTGDMNAMHEGLLNSTKEATKELAEHMDGVVTEVGKEHSAFIEIMGERLETMRRQLKIK